MQSIELYQPNSNPGMLIPRLFLSRNELQKMRPSPIRIVRTLAPAFGKICEEMSDEQAKIIIQQVPDETHWKVHVIKDGRVGSCSTADCNLVDALCRARSIVCNEPARIL